MAPSGGTETPLQPSAAKGAEAGSEQQPWTPLEVGPPWPGHLAAATFPPPLMWPSGLLSEWPGDVAAAVTPPLMGPSSVHSKSRGGVTKPACDEGIDLSDDPDVDLFNNDDGVLNQSASYDRVSLSESPCLRVQNKGERPLKRMRLDDKRRMRKRKFDTSPIPLFFSPNRQHPAAARPSDRTQPKGHRPLFLETRSPSPSPSQSPPARAEPRGPPLSPVSHRRIKLRVLPLQKRLREGGEHPETRGCSSRTAA